MTSWGYIRWPSLGLAIALSFPVLAQDGADPLAGAVALDEAAMGGARSGESSRHWDRKSVPAEPKQSKVGRMLFPDIKDLPKGGVHGGVRLPHSISGGGSL